jgi:hypothetical protein
MYDDWARTSYEKNNYLIPSYNGEFWLAEIIRDIEFHRTPESRLKLLEKDSNE